MKNFLLLLILSLLCVAANGQAVSWELSAQPGDQVSNLATFQSPNFANCTLSRGAGLTATTGAGSMNASGWFSGSTPTTLDDAIANNDYYEFTCNTINCMFFNPTTIKIVLRSSATGPNTATLRCSSDGFTANIGTATVTTTSTAFSFSETISPNSQSVTYRLYGYGGAAGGGNPAAGGTMRVGTSVVASDNDLEIFASTTLLTVSAVPNITVTNGDAVPATVFTANVPGATISWTRTPESIGLNPTSGSGNVPAFTASNGSSQPVTSTFTVHAAVGNCQSADMTFTITVNPPPCDILSINFLGNPSACSDNGTPNDPSDDFFTQNIQASFINRPVTGNLQIVPGGDQIGVYSIPVNQIVGNSHIFNAVKFKADGTPTVITMNFTDDPACSETKTGPTIQACSTPPPPCDILSINFLGNPSSCSDNGTPNDPSDDFFTQNLQASFINRPVTGNLQIVPGGDEIGTYSIPVNQIVGNSHIFNAVKFKADGTPTVITMNFTDDPACSETKTGPTIQSCSSGGGCDITNVTFIAPGSCNDNGTNDPSDDYFVASVKIEFVNPPNTGLLQIEPGGDAIGTYSIPAANLQGAQSVTFNNVKFKADGTPTVIEVEFTIPANQCVQTATGPTVSPCSPVCDITNVTFIAPGSCNDNGTNDPSDDYFVASVKIEFVNPPNTGLLQIEPGGDAIGTYSIPASNIQGAQSVTFNNVKLKADGTPTVIEVEFTIPANVCVQTAVGPTVGSCSFVPPVLTCPLAASVSCANEVPAVNIGSVSETHTCPGNVTITHLGDVNSNVFCINKLTITRTYMGADQCGKTSTCSQTITVNDQTPPTVTCPVALSFSCASQVPAVDLNSLGVTDNCAGGLGISRSFVGEVTNNQICANRFTLTRTYKGGDACGNTATCTQVITVNDQTPPSLSCPPPLTFSCFENVPPITPTSVTNLSDNCGGTAPTASVVGEFSSPNGICPNDFTITRVFRATDLCGNSATCSQLVTIKDQIPPTVACPAGLTFSCDEQVPAPNPALVTASDNCLGPVPTKVFVADLVSNQTCTNRKTISRTYRATDACGNSATCSQTITVNDQTPPVFTSVPANVTVDCYLVPSVGIATASDNCTSGATVTFLGETTVPGICPVWKIITRTWRATDVCGNSATASQVVTVTDFNAPQFLVLPKNKIVECGPNNAAEFQAFLDSRGGAVVQDCAPISYTFADAPFQSNYFDCGNTFHKNIRFFATDECGNVSFRDASFTVVDQTPPVFSTPPQSVELECDASNDNGQTAFYDWLDSNAGLVAEDNCGDVELEKIQVSEHAGCGNTWRKTYEFRAKDECGNLSKTTATFAVVDHTPPTLACPPNDNLYLPCIESVPAADPSALSAYDCSGVSFTLKDTWTNGTGCPSWPMTVAYRYAATDGCGNEAVCERAFYVKETDMPTLICPDTIKLVCVNDIPGPAQLFNAIKNQLVGNCPGGFSSIIILSDSGQPLNGATHRTYTFKAKNHCGKLSPACSVTFKATGTCNQLCTASQASWGDPNGTIGGMPTTEALQTLLAQHGPVTVGGVNHIVSAADPACVQELLFGSGTIGFLPIGNHTCPLPASLANGDGSLNNQLAANAMALQLNIWYNQAFNNRNFGGQNLHNLPPCLVDFAFLKDMGPNSTVNDLLFLTNQYLQGFVGNHTADYPAILNDALDNLNHFRVDCGLNAPCERPAHGRSEELAAHVTGFKLVPNPATDAVTMTFESATVTPMSIQISDGRAVLLDRTIQAEKGLNTVEFSLEQLPAGVFYVSVKSEQGTKTLRLVKVTD